MRSLAITLLALLSIASIVYVSTARAQTAPAVVSLTNSVIEFAPARLNTDGSAVTDLKGYLFAIAPDGIDLAAGLPPLQSFKVEGAALPQCPDELCRVDAFPLLDGLGDAGPFRAWYQAYDLAGNVSKYSPASDPFTLDGTVPVVSGKPQIVVKVIVEVKASP